MVLTHGLYVLEKEKDRQKITLIDPPIWVRHSAKHCLCILSYLTLRRISWIKCNYPLFSDGQLEANSSLAQISDPVSEVTGFWWLPSSLLRGSVKASHAGFNYSVSLSFCYLDKVSYLNDNHKEAPTAPKCGTYLPFAFCLSSHWPVPKLSEGVSGFGLLYWPLSG